MIEIRIDLLFYKSLIGVYDADKDEVRLLDTLFCTDENKETIRLLCKTAGERKEVGIVIDNRFVKEKGKLW